MRRAFDAIRDTARMAWWDGSALGLRLNSLIDIFGVTESEIAMAPETTRS